MSFYIHSLSTSRLYGQFVIGLFLAGLICEPSFAQSGADESVMKELVRKNIEFAKQWNEGFIEAKIEGLDGTADVLAWWVGDRSRREMVDYGLDGFRSPSKETILINSQTFCKFSPELLTANCERRIVYPQLGANYRVLPTESWLEILSGVTIHEWLNRSLQRTDPLKSTRVSKTSDGYKAILGTKEAVAQCILAIESGETPQFGEGEYVTIVKFNSYGLLVSNEYLGAAPSNTLLFNYEWSSDPVPMPRVLVRKSRTNPAQDYQVALKITVNKVGNRLPGIVPSLAVPPSDLPFGTKIINKTSGDPAISFVGGDEGRSHHSLLRAGLRLKDALKN